LKGHGESQEDMISPIKAVQLLVAMGVAATIEQIGVDAQRLGDDTMQTNPISPFFMNVIMLIMGMLVGLLVRDCCVEIMPSIRQLGRQFMRRCLRRNGEHHAPNVGQRNTQVFIQSIERRLGSLEEHIDEQVRQEAGLDRNMNPVPTSSSGRASSRSKGNGKGRSQGARARARDSGFTGGYPPAAEEEEQDEEAPPPRQQEEEGEEMQPAGNSVTSPSPVLVPPRRQANLSQPAMNVDDVDDVPIPAVPVIPMLPMIQIDRDNIFDEAQARGLGMNIMCVYTTRFGRRVHLFPDGGCLAGTGMQADGMTRDLNTLQVCWPCQARFRSENNLVPAAEATDAPAAQEVDEEVNLVVNM
jgi:hypothetical protein